MFKQFHNDTALFSIRSFLITHTQQQQQQTRIKCQNMENVNMPFGRFLKSSKRKNETTIEEIEEDSFFSSASSSHEEDVVTVCAQVVAELSQIKETKPRSARKERSHLKVFWDSGYDKLNNAKFKERLRINRATFEYILEKITPAIIKTPTNMEPHPMEPQRQLALTLYRLGHGCSFRVTSDLFGVSVASAVATFNKVIRVMIANLYNEYVYMPKTEDEWIKECKGFIENYEFPCVGAWDGFHVHVSTRIKNYYIQK